MSIPEISIFVNLDHTGHRSKVRNAVSHAVQDHTIVIGSYPGYINGESPATFVTRLP